MAKLEVVKGTTSKLLQVFIQDSSSTTGAGLTGLVFNSAGLTAYYYREGAGSAVSITLATMTLGTWATGGFVVVDGTNMPGVYQLGIPDAALVSGANSVTVMLKGATNMAPLVLEIELTGFDLQVATPGVNVTQISGDTVAADNAEAWFDNTGFNASASTIGNCSAATVSAMNANTLTASAVATGAIDADALAADASTEIRSVASGTADSGTTTTMVDAARTEADTDYWRGALLVMTSGNIAGEARIISAFDPSTDTITVSRTFTQAIATQTYEIWPGDWANLPNLDAAVSTRSTVTTAQVNAEVVDTLATDTYAEPSAVVAATASLAAKITWLCAFARNRITQTSTTQSLRNDADSGNIATASISDDGSQFVRGEWV